MRPDDTSTRPAPEDVQHWRNEVAWRRQALAMPDVSLETTQELHFEIDARLTAIRRAEGAAEPSGPRPAVTASGHKFTPDEVRAIRQRHADGARARDLADELDVGEATIRRMLSRESYKHVSDEVRVTMGGRAKLTDEEVLEIRARIAANETHVAIASDYGVSASAIDRVARGSSYTHVEE